MCAALHKEFPICPCSRNEHLLIEQLRDLINAEGQLVKALPKMVKAARSQSLKFAFEHHLAAPFGAPLSQTYQHRCGPKSLMRAD